MAKIMSMKLLKQYLKDNGLEYYSNLGQENLVSEQRVHALQDGDIITAYGVYVEFEDGLFYEVEQRKNISNGNGVEWYTWERTGNVYTGEELNEISRNGVVE